MKLIGRINKIGIILSLAGVLALSGCSSNEKNETAKGYDCVITQNYDEAINHFNQALIDGEDMEQAYRGMGLVYMGRRDYPKAISAFKTALSGAGMFPGELEYDINYYMAVCYYKTGDFEAAISVYDGIIGMKPKDSKSYYMRGNMSLYMGDIESALADFDMAAELNKNDYSLLIDIYAKMREHGYETEGQRYLDIVLPVSTEKFNEYDKGRLSYYQGEYSQACNYLERARQADPANLDAVLLLSDCYKETGQYDYAALIYSTYLNSYPDPEVYNQLGMCYMEQGDYASALSAFQSGIEIKENNTCLQNLMINEIACYEYMLDFSSARQKLAEYMEIYPADETLKKEYAFLTIR